MARHTLACAALCCALSPLTSFAADLPARTLPSAPVPYSWTGFYAGANAGYGFGLGKSGTTSLAFPANANTSGSGFTNTNPLMGGVGTVINVLTLPTNLDLGRDRGGRSGFVGGGQIGYNYQFTPGSGVVIGLEADAQYADFGGARGNSDITVPATTTILGAPLFNPPAAVDRFGEPNLIADGGLQSVTLLRGRQGAGVEWFGTVRGRLGYAFDRVLVYGTGGFAYGQGRRDELTLGGGGIRTGWTAGGGIEFALAPDSWLNLFRAQGVTLKLEGLYVNLDRARGASVLYARDQSGNAYYAPASFLSGSRRSDDFAVVRVGLNVRF